MKYIYFDDEPRPRERIARRLTRGDLKVVSLAPPPDLSLSVDEDSIDGFLVDYVLTKPQPDGNGAQYKGGTLASALRDRYRALPIVLLTRENLVEDRDEERLLDELTVFDAVRFKGEIDRDIQRAREDLLGLGNGFAALRSCPKTWEGLIDLLAPPTADDTAVLREAPPTISDRQWDVVSVARWIGRVLLRYPGVLVDGPHAAAVLGLHPEALENSVLVEFLTPAVYSGPFGATSRRWWKRSLVKIATQAYGSEWGGPLHIGFPAAMLRMTGVELPVAQCVDCGEPAGARCFVLEVPVKHEHSLLYFPDQRPGVMDSARVSFVAIRESNDVQDERIDPTAAEIVSRLRTTVP